MLCDVVIKGGAAVLPKVWHVPNAHTLRELVYRDLQTMRTVHLSSGGGWERAHLIAKRYDNLGVEWVMKRAVGVAVARFMLHGTPMMYQASPTKAREKVRLTKACLRMQGTDGNRHPLLRELTKVVRKSHSDAPSPDSKWRVTSYARHEGRTDTRRPPDVFIQPITNFCTRNKICEAKDVPALSFRYPDGVWRAKVNGKKGRRRQVVRFGDDVAVDYKELLAGEYVKEGEAVSYCTLGKFVELCVKETCYLLVFPLWYTTCLTSASQPVRTSNRAVTCSRTTARSMTKLWHGAPPYPPGYQLDQPIHPKHILGLVMVVHSCSKRSYKFFAKQTLTWKAMQKEQKEQKQPRLGRRVPTVNNFNFKQQHHLGKNVCRRWEVCNQGSCEASDICNDSDHKRHRVMEYRHFFRPATTNYDVYTEVAGFHSSLRRMDGDDVV